MDELEEKSFMVAKNYTNLMDNLQQWSSHELSDDAVLDWFGRTVFGRESIINFMKINVPKMRHTIESITKIPAINHRLLKIHDDKANQMQTPKLLTKECGQGDCKGQSTPENTIYPNLRELVKAPRKKRLQFRYDTPQWQFIEIRGKLELEETLHDGTTILINKKFQRIILGYTDQIHFIAYEAKSLCRKKLLFPKC